MNYLRTATAIGNALLEPAARGSRAHSWKVSDVLSGKPTGEPWDVYMGSAGPALFLYLLGRYTESSRFRRAGEGAIRSVLQKVDPQTAAPGMVGLSGIGQILLIMDRLEDARTIGDHVMRRRDVEFELLYGSAGAGTFLLSLYRRSGARKYLQAARRRGERLLRQGPPWPCAGEYFVGYSHGLSGIGDFLLRLYEETGKTRFRQAAASCGDLIAEHSRERGGRLLAPRSLSAPYFPMAWCHGSPGVLLFESSAARILGGTLREPLAEKRARAVLHDSTSRSPRSLCYCHGLAGNLDMLIEHGWVAEARRVADRKLLPPPLAGKRRMTFISRRSYRQPGFFVGDAGIGFTLLRLALPEIPLFYRVL